MSQHNNTSPSNGFSDSPSRVIQISSRHHESFSDIEDYYTRTNKGAKGSKTRLFWCIEDIISLPYHIILISLWLAYAGIGSVLSSCLMKCGINLTEKRIEDFMKALLHLGILAFVGYLISLMLGLSGIKAITFWMPQLVFVKVGEVQITK